MFNVAQYVIQSTRGPTINQSKQIHSVLSNLDCWPCPGRC